MMYALMAIVGGLAGWFIVTYMGVQVAPLIAVILGVVGGLLGVLVGTLLGSIAVVLIKIILGIVAAYVLIRLWQNFASRSKS